METCPRDVLAHSHLFVVSFQRSYPLVGLMARMVVPSMQIVSKSGYEFASNAVLSLKTLPSLTVQNAPL